jgi:hypothetical protein
VTQQQIKGQTGTVDSNGFLDTYDVPGAVLMTPYAVSVSVDGTGASGNFLPCLTFKTQTGAIIARCPAPEVANGDAAEVSWFPHVAQSTSAPPVSSGLGTMIATTNFGTDLIVPAGTTRTLKWDEIVFDTSGTFGTAADPTHTWSIEKSGQFQILFCVTPNGSWPASGSGPIVMEILDPDANLVLRAGSIFDADGSSESPVLTGMVSTSGGSVPARVRVGLKNTTATDFTTLGGQTFLTMNRLGDEVDF